MSLVSCMTLGKLCNLSGFLFCFVLVGWFLICCEIKGVCACNHHACAQLSSPTAGRRLTDGPKCWLPGFTPVFNKGTKANPMPTRQGTPLIGNFGLRTLLKVPGWIFLRTALEFEILLPNLLYHWVKVLPVFFGILPFILHSCFLNKSHACLIPSWRACSNTKHVKSLAQSKCLIHIGYYYSYSSCS